MTTFDATFWEARGKQEFASEIPARSFTEAAGAALAECDALARETGTAWVLMSLCDERFNSPAAMGRIAIEGEPSRHPGEPAHAGR